MSGGPHSPARPRALSVDGLVNGRDLGGLRRQDGSITPSNVFYRSESIDQVSERGWNQVYDEGIRTVVDLRQPGEREQDRTARPSWLTVERVDLDGLDNTKFWVDYWETGLVGTAMYYLPHLAAMPERTAAVLAAIANAPAGGVLFHCASGRDRTGMIAMILLAAIDTECDEIVDDYLETVRLGDVRAASVDRENNEAEIQELCRQHGTTTERAFRSALSGFDAERYLADAPLSEGERRAILSWRGSMKHR